MSTNLPERPVPFVSTDSPDPNLLTRWTRFKWLLRLHDEKFSEWEQDEGHRKQIAAEDLTAFQHLVHHRIGHLRPRDKPWRYVLPEQVKEESPALFDELVQAYSTADTSFNNLIGDTDARLPRQFIEDQEHFVKGERHGYLHPFFSEEAAETSLLMLPLIKEGVKDDLRFEATEENKQRLRASFSGSMGYHDYWKFRSWDRPASDELTYRPASSDLASKAASIKSHTFPLPEEVVLYRALYMGEDGKDRAYAEDIMLRPEKVFIDGGSSTTVVPRAVWLGGGGNNNLVLRILGETEGVPLLDMTDINEFEVMTSKPGVFRVVDRSHCMYHNYDTNRTDALVSKGSVWADTLTVERVEDVEWPAN